MSYDITFKVKAEGVDVWVPVGECYANITWNVREIIRLSTGLQWKNEANNGLCKDVIPCIDRGLSELYRYPEKYKQYEAPNGWGTVEGTERFFLQILKDWENFIHDYGEELANIATFWIE